MNFTWLHDSCSYFPCPSPIHPHPLPQNPTDKHFHWFLHVSSIRSYFHITNSCNGVVIYNMHSKSCLHHPMCSCSRFSSVFPLLCFFLCMWIVFFSRRSHIVALDQCIASSRGVHSIWFYHSVAASVYNVYLVLLLSLCVNSWRSFQFTWNSSSSLLLWAQ